jgi:predicted secreted protein
MGESRTKSARRAYEHLQRLLSAATDNDTRGRLRAKLAGAKRRLETLERNHDKRQANADAQSITGEWWNEINRPRH